AFPLDLQALRFAQHLVDVGLVDTVEHRGGDLDAEDLRGIAEMRLEHLSHVHAAWHAEGIQDDVHRTSVGHEWQILHGNHAGDDALVSVPTGHFVTDLDLALAGHVYLDLPDLAGVFAVAALVAVHDLVAPGLEVAQAQPEGLHDLVNLVLG